jgi:EmrB/QacA subfamily drug resistance transporter
MSEGKDDPGQTPAPNPRFVALIVASSMFMAQLDSTVVLTALPQIARSFHVRPVDLSIGVTVYMLAQAVFLPASGWIADRFGARNVFAAAILLFVVSSVACGLSPNLGAFVMARIVQGFAAACMTPVARVVLFRFTPKRELVSAMTIASAAMLIAPTIGPPLGGFISTYGAWPWIFMLNVPPGLIGAALVLRFIPNFAGGVRRPFDTLGFVLSGGALSLFLYGLDRLGSSSAGGWALSVSLTLAGLGLGAAAALHVRRAMHPIVSLSVFRSKIFSILSIGGGALSRLPVRAAPFLLSLMFQTSLGMSAFKAGLLLLGFSAGDLVLKAGTTQTIRRFGFRKVILHGAFWMTLALIACVGFGPATPWWAIIAVLVVAGMFRSLLFTGMSTLIYADITPDQVGAATVLWNVTQQVTNALGISLAAIVLRFAPVLRGAAHERASLADFRIALGVMGVFGLLSMISFARLPRDAGAEMSAA